METTVNVSLSLSLLLPVLQVDGVITPVGRSAGQRRAEPDERLLALHRGVRGSEPKCESLSLSICLCVCVCVCV